MASHIFICRLVPGDLDKLNRTKHCNPDQLNANPQIKNKGKCVADHITTDRIIDDVAFGFCRCWQNVDIFKAVSRNIRVKEERKICFTQVDTHRKLSTG